MLPLQNAKKVCPNTHTPACGFVCANTCAHTGSGGGRRGGTEEAQGSSRAKAEEAAARKRNEEVIQTAHTGASEPAAEICMQCFRPSGDFGTSGIDLLADCGVLTRITDGHLCCSRCWRQYYGLPGRIHDIEPESSTLAFIFNTECAVYSLHSDK